MAKKDTLNVIEKLERAFNASNKDIERNTKESLDWFRKYITKNYKNVRIPRLLETDVKVKTQFKIGDMLSFQYNPIGKEKLPYYDTFPLIFPISENTSKEGKKYITGLNCHYLLPVQRQRMFLALHDLAKQRRLDWNVLKRMSEHKLFEAAIHNYRLDAIQSNFIIFPQEYYDIVLFLPIARFKKGKPY